MPGALLIRFSNKTSATEAERETLKELARILGTTETKAVHIAINRLFGEMSRHGTDDKQQKGNEMSEMTKNPIDQMFNELASAPGVEMRPITETDKERVRSVFEKMGVDVTEGNEKGE